MSDQSTEVIEEMFVQLASGVEAGDMKLTLRGVSPSTLYFSDRPERIVGHMTTDEFVGEWGEGPNSFESDPPNAVLSFPDPTGGLDDAVVVLTAPVLQGDSLQYDIEVLDGAVPAEAGNCTLFIDPLGRPLSPVSLAGVNRRGRRRMRRRL